MDAATTLVLVETGAPQQLMTEVTWETFSFGVCWWFDYCPSEPSERMDLRDVDR